MKQEVTYEDHLAFLERQIERAIWEKRGFVDAKSVLTPVLPSDPAHARAYQDGLYNGQVKLMLQGVEA